MTTTKTREQLAWEREVKKQKTRSPAFYVDATSNAVVAYDARTGDRLGMFNLQEPSGRGGAAASKGAKR